MEEKHLLLFLVCGGLFTALAGMCNLSLGLKLYGMGRPAPLPVQAEAAESTPTPSPTPTEAPVFAPVAEYQTQFPSLYASPVPAATPAEKTVYLTFDDGPSANTAAILQALEAYNAKACWFVTGRSIAGHEAELRAIAAAGHTIGLHSDSHEYKEIYASPEAFLADLQAVSDAVEAACGVRSGLVRFPGGSVNNFNADTRAAICAELLRRGYRYYDWNASAQDAVSPQRSVGDTARRVIDGAAGKPYAVVLLHDTKANTAAAVPAILQALTDAGCTFAALEPSVPMVTLGYTEP